MSQFTIGSPFWLKLTNLNSYKYFISLDESFTDPPVESCTDFIRISPVFFLTNPPENFSFTSKWKILFLYNTPPRVFLKYFEDEVDKNGISFCVTWGLANIILFQRIENDGSEKFIKKLKKKINAWEEWTVIDGAVEDMQLENFKPDPLIGTSIPNLSPHTLETKTATDEYLVSINQIILNCQRYTPEFTEYFERFHNQITTILFEDKKLTNLQKVDYIVSINSSISRILTQLFNGCNGIVSNPCPIANHSLLGIGLANIALLKFSKFIEQHSSEYEINYLLRKNKKLSITIVDERDINNRISSIKRDLDALKTLSGAPKNNETTPIMPFFSSRDGFKYGKITNISVPLMCLYNGNRYSWNLLSVTHELSHLIVEGLTKILESSNPKSFITTSERNQGKLPITGKTILIDYALSLYYAAQTRIRQSLISNGQYFDVEAHINEIITHLVDFLLFYDGKIEQYFKFIWSSWLTIPDVEERFKWYLIRTGVAILSINLEKSREDFLKETLRTGLMSLYRETKNEIYIKIIEKTLDDANSWSEIFEIIVDSIPLIELVTLFVFDEKIAARISKEPRLLGGKTLYDLTVGNLTNNDDTVTNPVFFIKNYCKNDREKEAHAIWIYLNLAFSNIAKIRK